MRRNSGIVGPTKTIGVRPPDINGIFDIFDVYNHRLVDVWPYTKRYTSHTVSSYSITELDTITLTVYTSGFYDGEYIYYTINTVSGPTMTGADFADGVAQGQIEVNSNVGTVQKIMMPGDGTENNQMQFQIRFESTSGPIMDTSSTITVADAAGAAPGQQVFTSSGTFIPPAGVTDVCVVAVGGGGGGMHYGCCSYAMMGGGGGGLGYKNGISVTAGNNYSVVVGQGGIGGPYSSGSQAGGDSYFISTSTVKGGGGQPGRWRQDAAGGTYTGDGGGNGGMSDYQGSYQGPGGGGGAGGYSGNGGNGRSSAYGSGYAGNGGGGGGGAGSGSANYQNAYGGGGVGLLGQGSNGAAGNTWSGGGGGSGGSSGQTSGVAGLYGGGGGGGTNFGGDPGGNGAVRILWGAGRAYPSTNTGDV
jgi:hypothetical protein